MPTRKSRAGHDRTRRLTLRRGPENIVRTVRNEAESKNPAWFKSGLQLRSMQVQHSRS